MASRFSLWLLPPASAEVANKLSNIISNEIPSLFPHEKLPSFAPHITLATGINESFFGSKSAQAWLTSLELSQIDAGDVKITFAGVKTGITFTKKCYLQASRTSSFEDLAKQLHMRIFGAREEEATLWVKEDWDPHLSLLYWVGQIQGTKLEEIRTLVVREGFDSKSGECEAWIGGVIQLVNTSKAVEQWEVLAERAIDTTTAIEEE